MKNAVNFYTNGKEQMNINWNLYKQFYFVAKYGSTSAASKELLVAQPSVSLGIKQLEGQLGCELFKRSYRGMELTEQGKTLYEYISSAYKSISKAEEGISSCHKQDANTINIAAIDTTLHIFLLPAIESFRKLNPEINVKVHICKEIEDAEELIDSGAVDFAVMHFPSESSRFLNTPVKKIFDALVCGAKYADRIPHNPLPAHELKDIPFVSLQKTSPSRRMLDNYFKSNGLELEVAYEFMHSSSITRHVKENFALGFVLENVIKYELERGELVKIDVDPPIPPRYYYMITPNEMRPVAQKMADYLLATRGQH